MAQTRQHAPARATHHPNLREIFLLAFKPGPLLLLQLVHKYGDVIHIKMPPVEIFILSNPDDIREVLVVQQGNFYKGLGVEITGRVLGKGLLTSEGSFHKHQRRLIQPAFHRQRIAGYAQAMVEITQKVAGKWQDGATIDMVDEMMHLTFIIAGRTLFNVDVEQETSVVQQAVAMAMEAFVKVGLSPWAKQLEHLPLPINKRLDRARDRIDRVIYGIIDEHRQAGTDQGDLLSMLLLAEDEDGHTMSNQQLRDEVATLLLAGHETTANALSWTWYLLSQHPDVSDLLHQEVDAVLGDRPPTIDDIPRLPYTEQVLTEAMRLYPPAWAIDRRTIRESTLNGVRIPKGARIVISQYVVHHDPRHYPEPEQFDPGRWTPAERADRPRFAYFPFGGGTRLCIGESFAWTEGILILATLARHWEAEMVQGHPVAIEAAVTTRPRYGLRMILRKRG